MASLWLKTALEKEVCKYTMCPVTPDVFPQHEAAQAWGYVVAAYSLAEQGLKELLRLREIDVPHIHELSTLFGRLAERDQVILREYYDDYRALRAEEEDDARCGTLDTFLAGLDGEECNGSVAWRYYPTEEAPTNQMPRVSINYLHEVIRGCVWVIEHEADDISRRAPRTLSQREYENRAQKLRTWLNLRLCSTGSFEGGDHWEIVWGPDYRGRYDLVLFQGDNVGLSFQKKPGDPTLRVVDMRPEFNAFDPTQAPSLIEEALAR